MPYGTGIITSIFGRRLGLQSMSSAQSGTQKAGTKCEFLVGPDAFRLQSSTADTTATGLRAYGVSVLSSAQTAASGAIMVLDAPIPGVEKIISIQSTAAGVASTIAWVIRASDSGANFQSSWSSSFTTLTSSVAMNMRLVGLTTAMWALVSPQTSAAFVTAATTT